LIRIYSRRKYRAISEMISILILMGIAIVAGYFLYRAYVLQAQRQQLATEIATEIARKRIAERFTLVDGYIKIYDNGTKHLVLVIYNFGDTDIMFTKIYLPAVSEGGRLKVLSFEVNKTIKMGDTDVISVKINDPTVSYPPGIIVKVNIMTDISGPYTFEVKTIG